MQCSKPVRLRMWTYGGHGVFWMCSSAHTCRTLLTQYLEKYWTYFHQTFSIGTLWNKDEPSSFGIKGSFPLVQGYGVQRAGNCTFVLVNAISWKLLNWISPNISVRAFWDKDERFSFGVKRSKIKVTAWPKAQRTEAYRAREKRRVLISS